jgi:Zn-dependent protease
MPTRQGAIRLFRFAGVNVYLHWSWFLIAVIEIQSRARSYSSLTFNVIEYLSLFVIVLLHEYGHALACRSVGGNADQIVLWPLGGVAYVDPPQRAGAMLWSIAAGPLVNVTLLPIFTVLVFASRTLGWAAAMPDVYALLRTVWIINLVLLVFNLLPIYPLDGGQILRSLLWFPLGRARSLMAATIFGFVGVAGLLLFAFWTRSTWNFVMAGFVLLNCWGGLRHAQHLLKLAKIPRRPGFACPWCQAEPPLGELWKCGQCGRPFDTFAAQGVCPACHAQFVVTQCLDCGRKNPMSTWMAGATPVPKS